MSQRKSCPDPPGLGLGVNVTTSHWKAININKIKSGFRTVNLGKQLRKIHKENELHISVWSYNHGKMAGR
jgi:hypothetical protein